MPWLISIGFKALGLGKAALAWLMRNPLVLVCCILAATTFVYRGNALHCHQTVKARDATIAAMLEASKAELARANAERDAAIKHEKEQNDATDARVAAARADDARRLDAYLGRLRAAFGDGHRSQVPATAGQNVAKSSNGPGATPIVDALSDDLAICTTNSRRLLEIHNEATQ